VSFWTPFLINIAILSLSSCPLFRHHPRKFYTETRRWGGESKGWGLQCTPKVGQ